jgi:gas vesicle protein
MNDKRNKVAAAVLAGLALGAAAWYLFGTESGKSTRGKLADSINDLNGSLKDLRSRATDTIDKLSGRADKLAQSVSSEVKKSKKDLKAAY